MKNVAVPVSLCMAVAVLEGFDIQAMGVAAPRLAPEFGLGASQMGWVFSVSNIGLVIGAAFGGWLADRVGRKPVFIGAVATFGVDVAQPLSESGRNPRVHLYISTQF